MSYIPCASRSHPPTNSCFCFFFDATFFKHKCPKIISNSMSKHFYSDQQQSKFMASHNNKIKLRKIFIYDQWKHILTQRKCCQYSDSIFQRFSFFSFDPLQSLCQQRNIFIHQVRCSVDRKTWPAEDNQVFPPFAFQVRLLSSFKAWGVLWFLDSNFTLQVLTWEWNPHEVTTTRSKSFPSLQSRSATEFREEHLTSMFQ